MMMAGRRRARRRAGLAAMRGGGEQDSGVLRERERQRVMSTRDTLPCGRRAPCPLKPYRASVHVASVRVCARLCARRSARGTLGGCVDEVERLPARRLGLQLHSTRSTGSWFRGLFGVVQCSEFISLLRSVECRLCTVVSCAVHCGNAVFGIGGVTAHTSHRHTAPVTAVRTPCCANKLPSAAPVRSLVPVFLHASFLDRRIR